MAKSIIQAEKECYICRRWYNVRTTSGMEEHQDINGPLQPIEQRNLIKLWL